MHIDKDKFKEDYLNKLMTMYTKSFEEASKSDRYRALGSLVRDYAAKDWIMSKEEYRKGSVKQVYYFSIEFLPGRLLGSNLINMGLDKVCKEVLKELGCSLYDIEPAEPDAALGSGGLGRLAACFLDSMASLGIPGHGCGIRYKHGLFKQRIIDGYQAEFPEDWLREGNPWEIRKPDRAVEVRFGGEVTPEHEGNEIRFRHENYETVWAIPYDMPIIGYNNGIVNTLRLWSAENPEDDTVEAITQVLYPDDGCIEGRRLRLKQQYFFTSAGLQSIVRAYKASNGNIMGFDKKVAVHINDTHPAVAIPELMRILMDQEGVDWDTAWKMTSGTISYTNHTILSEALEKWPVDMFKQMLPRIYMIIGEINERFCKGLWNSYPEQWDKIRQMAIISDGHVKMAHLAIAGSHSVNGVSKIHTEILKKQELVNFYHFHPDKFNNKTNGIAHRRWLLKSNPELAELLSDLIGTGWIMQPDSLINLLKYKYDASVQERIMKVKYDNKLKLVKIIKQRNNIDVNPSSIFDVQIKRMHAYKRQLLNVLHIMHLYNCLIKDPKLDIIPRTFIFGAKAAQGYCLAKKEIKLINTLADKINNDRTIEDKLKVVFMEDYKVSLAERIIPAADVSEQISTATKEASGTGNMKLMMNGAVTVATLDGANIEIRDEVGDGNIILFGMNKEEVTNYYKNGGYSAIEMYESDPRIRTVVDQLVNGFFPVDCTEFREIYDHILRYNDEYFVLKDFNAYAEAQKRVDGLYRHKSRWACMSIENIAHSGVFSSDRTVSEYASDIWKVKG